MWVGFLGVGFGGVWRYCRRYVEEKRLSALIDALETSREIAHRKHQKPETAAVVDTKKKQESSAAKTKRKEALRARNIHLKN